MSLEERIRLAPKASFFFIGILLAAAFWYSQTSPDDMFDNQIQSLQGQVTELSKKVAETEARFNDKKKFQDEMEQVSQLFRLALDYLPKELDTQDLLRKITIEAKAAGVDLLKVSPKEKLPGDFYDELPIDTSIRGTYVQMVQFLAAISKLPRIINVKGVEISAPTFVEGQPVMQMTGTLVAYRYKETK